MLTIIKSGVETVSPPCSVLEVTLNTLQRTAERTANGKLVRETLPDKWTLDMEWEFSTPDAYYAWFSYLKGLTRVDFTVRFPAPTGSMETAIMYISPISAKMLTRIRGDTGQWTTLKCSFVEV
jgi:hypothetical protein